MIGTWKILSNPKLINILTILKKKESMTKTITTGKIIRRIISLKRRRRWRKKFSIRSNSRLTTKRPWKYNKEESKKWRKEISNRNAKEILTRKKERRNKSKTRDSTISKDLTDRFKIICNLSRQMLWLKLKWISMSKISIHSRQEGLMFSAPWFPVSR